jgi:hypothetical protein
MKSLLIVLGVLGLPFVGLGQIQSNLTQLNTSPEGIIIGEVSLYYRSRTEPKDLHLLGSQKFYVPRNPNGEALKMEYYRFWTRPSQAFVMDGQTYIPVSLGYDRETLDVA